jgi:hypothetical protein
MGQFRLFSHLINRFRVRSLAVLLAGILAWPGTLLAIGSPNSNEGYLSTTQSVENERYEEISDLPLIAPPPPTGPDLRSRIFNNQLSKEFRESYEDKFGRTAAERTYYAPNKYTYFDDPYTLNGTPEDISGQRRAFGEYMIRRLLEYHVDNYAKNDPGVKPLWEAKEKLSNIKAEVQRMKFDARYDFAGNTLDVREEGPYFNSKLTFQMGGGSPGGVGETIFSVSRGLTPTVGLEGRYYFTDGVISWITSKSLTPQLSSTFTVSTFTKPVGTTVRESLYLAGLSYTF